jgi:hypothetical protein
MRVMREWTETLPIRMQSTMMLALRGPDTVSKENKAKVLIRELRFAILHPAFPVGLERLAHDDFMGFQMGYCTWNIAEEFLADHDQYPHHWLLHLAHAAEIVGQFHPDEKVRHFWFQVYTALCSQFHMNPETLEQLNDRLRRTKTEQAAAIQLTDFEHRLVNLVRSIPGWIRMQLIFFDTKMDHARLKVADALEEEVRTRLKNAIDTHLDVKAT